jgi:hypothetical protein
VIVPRIVLSRPSRASARNARTRTAARTDGTNTHRGIPERETVRDADAEDTWRSRIANGLPERIENPAAITTLTLARKPSRPGSDLPGAAQPSGRQLTIAKQTLMDGTAHSAGTGNRSRRPHARYRNDTADQLPAFARVRQDRAREAGHPGDNPGACGAPGPPTSQHRE